MTLDDTAVRDRLPHRAPMLLVRSFTTTLPGERGSASVDIDLDAFLFSGWRGRELYQELVLEAAAQALGLLFADTAARSGAVAPTPAAPPPAAHLLLGFNDVALTTAHAQSALTLEVAVVQRMGGMCRGRFQANAGAATVAQGELTVMQGASDAA